MVAIFEISSDSENESDLHPNIQLPSSDDEQSPPQKRSRTVPTTSTVNPPKSYWEKVIAAGNEMLSHGIQLGGGKEAEEGFGFHEMMEVVDRNPKRKDKEPIDPSQRNGKILDSRLFDGAHHKCWSAAMVQSQYLKACRVAVRVEMLNGYKIPYPDDALIAMIKQIVFYTEKAAIKQRLRPNHFIIQVESHLLDASIFVHLRTTKDSAFQEILAEFERIDQSNRAKGRPSIIEGPFIIDCNAIEAKLKKRTAPKRPRQRFHPGGGPIRQKRQQKQLKVKYNVHNGAFWENLPEISQTHCLFTSILISCSHALMPTNKFSSFKTRPHAQKDALYKMLNWCKIKNHRRYSIEEYGERIQAYYDKFHPGKIRIFAFKSVSTDFKPFWASETDEYEKAVCIFYDVDEKHYLPLKLPGRLFGTKSQYCFKCFSPYTKQCEHKASCLCNCLNCMRVGPKFPCEPEDGYQKCCEECHKTFYNADCYAHHQKKRTTTLADGKKVESSVCTRSKHCKKCGVTYRKRADGKPHNCEDRWCMKCKSRHIPGRFCFMQYMPKSTRPQRFIAYDFETTPVLLPEKEFRFRHCVNFCQAYVWCSSCKDKGVWDKPLDHFCVYCGDQRSFSWSSTDVGFADSKHFQLQGDDEILPAFVDWLLNFNKDTLHIPEQTTHKKRKGEKYLMNEEEVSEDEEEEEEGEIVQMDLIEELEKEERGNKVGKKCVSSVYAHCGSRYDHVILFSEILKRKGLQISKPIRRGNKLMQLEVKKTGIVTHTIFRDSYNLISIPLDSFVKTFDLKIPGIPGKMHFPHGFNRPENYHKELQNLPDLDFYSPGTKNPKAKKELEEWYAANQHRPFCLKEVLAKYCYFDVQILAHGIVKMQELYKETSGLDITRYLTMASACVSHFLKTLEKEVVDADGNKAVERTKVAIVPEMGYERRENSSAIATKYLKWLAHKNQWDIEHAQTEAGEMRVCDGKYAVDGYVRRPGHPNGDLALEIYGCFWHGCPIHFSDDTQAIGYGRTAESTRQRDAFREAEIRDSGIELITFWECEINEMLEKDPLEYEEELLENREENIAQKVAELEEMHDFMAYQIDNGPIEVSDAFFGGRTGAEWMGCEVPEGHCMKYKDVNSLYPTMNMKSRYPIGHPTPKFWPEIDVDWRKPGDMVDPDNGAPLEGIIKGFVVPPKCPKWGVAVLPLRVGKRLLFPLCRKCAEKNPKGCLKLGYECRHGKDEERGWVFTLTHVELGKALEAGYRVIKLFRAYLWPDPKDWSDDLFTEYIRCWMKHKYHATGWPANCTDARLPERVRERNKEKLCVEAYVRYGIVLEREKMIFNPGLRFLAKQALNSLWGRLALRNRLTKTIITDNISEISRLLNNRTVRITMLDQVSEQYWMLSYETKREATVEHATSNPIIALWTTSMARCHLLEQLRGVYKDQRRMTENPDAFPNGILRLDSRILYMDTDSVIYTFRSALGDPLLDGEHLGEMKDEYPDHILTEFWCLAPKAYALKMVHSSGSEEQAVKTRAITLDHNTAQKVNVERVKEMVLDMYNPEKEGENYENVKVSNNFRAGRAGGITTIPMNKRFGPTLNKGILRENYHLAPYGFKICRKCSQQNLPQCICMFPTLPTIFK